MKQILCYGDSNTWGLIPGTHDRYPWGVRWTSLLQEMLGSNFRVIEEGLCGRTTIYEDKARKHRNGLDTLPLMLESHTPVDYAILMLGTNDCKSCYHLNAHQIAQGIDQCLEALLGCIPADHILLISPIHLGDSVWLPEYDPEFNEQSVIVSTQLKEEYALVAKQKGVRFLAASDYILPSMIDQEHMDAESHKLLAEKISVLLSGNISIKS